MLSFFEEFDKLILKVKKIWSSWCNLEEEEEKKVVGVILYNIKAQYKAIVVQMIWYGHKNRDIDQWNGTESTEIKLSFLVNWFQTTVSKAPF